MVIGIIIIQVQLLLSLPARTLLRSQDISFIETGRKIMLIRCR